MRLKNHNYEQKLNIYFKQKKRNYGNLFAECWAWLMCYLWKGFLKVKSSFKLMSERHIVRAVPNNWAEFLWYCCRYKQYLVWSNIFCFRFYIAFDYAIYTFYFKVVVYFQMILLIIEGATLYPTIQYTTLYKYYY